MMQTMWNKIRRLTVWILAVLVLVGAVLTVGGCSAGAPAATRAETTQSTTEAPKETEAETPKETEAETLKEAQSEESEETQSEAPEEAQSETPEETQSEAPEEESELPDEYGTFTTKEEVAAYLHAYGHLPDNYITKKEAEALGWNSKKGNLWDIAPGMSIGGSRFGNYEKKLPEKNGRKYFECDLNYDGGYRGAERLIYSNDGLIFYTGDHYETFEQLY